MFENKYYDQWWKEMLFDQTHPKIVSHTEFVKAAEAWFSFAGKQRKSSYRSLITFLNVGKLYKDRKWVDRKTDNVHVSEQTAQYVRALTSPHWRTLLKVHLIRKEASNHG